MSVPVITVRPGFVQDNLQHSQLFTGELTIGPRDSTYPAETGGIPALAALVAALFPTTNANPHAVQLWSTTGSGYIYTYIKSTGNIQIFEVPPSGSLTTAAPLQELGSNSESLSAVSTDIIQFAVWFRRNAS